MLVVRTISCAHHSRAPREYVCGLWVRGSDQAGLCCGVLQRPGHLHPHHQETRRHVLLPGPCHRLLTGQTSLDCIWIFQIVFCIGTILDLVWILACWIQQKLFSLHFFSPGPWCGPQGDEQRDSRGDWCLPSLQQSAPALPLHQTQLSAEAQGKTYTTTSLVALYMLLFTQFFGFHLMWMLLFAAILQWPSCLPPSKHSAQFEWR